MKVVKRSFVPLRHFRDIRDANRQLQAWILGPAGNRIHGTTHARPLTRFANTEREFLKPLPAHPPEHAAWAKVKVHGDCHVQFEKCRYSVPYALVRQQLWLRASPATVRIYQDQKMVAVHPRKNTPGARSTVKKHLPPEARAFLMRDPQWFLKKAQTIGPACHTLIKTLFSNRVPDNLRLRRAGFRGEKTLEGFDFAFNPAINQALIKDLATCAFIKEKVAVLIAERYERAATIVTSNLDFSE